MGGWQKPTHAAVIVLFFLNEVRKRDKEDRDNNLVTVPVFLFPVLYLVQQQTSPLHHLVEQQ